MKGPACLFLQADRPAREAAGETRVVGPKSGLLNLDRSQKKGIRFFQLALTEEIKKRVQMAVLVHKQTDEAIQRLVLGQSTA